MSVPFVDLHAQYLSIKSEVDGAIQDCLNTSSFIGGSKVKKFEEEFASYVGSKFCVSCGNGTDSIEILLKAMGIGPGDEVIVPAMTWISTSEAVSSVGANPVFVDIHPDYYTIDVTKIESKITSKTKAIIPVHLYGLPCEMDEILSLARKYKLTVLEDCAQAHGAVYKGKKVGTMGNAASFSFYPGKNLGAYGDAGAMVTNDEGLAETAGMITNHGQKAKHDHRMEGRNSRLDTIHAAVLSVKLKHLDNWNSKRRSTAASYCELLKDAAIKLPSSPEYSKHVFHLFVVQTDDRGGVMDYLTKKNIDTAIHYPSSLPFVKAYEHLKLRRDDFPVSSVFQEKIISLPMFAELTEDKISYVTEMISERTGRASLKVRV